MLETPYMEALKTLDVISPSGKLTAIHGLVLEASGCDVRQGELVEVHQAKDGERVTAEVIGLHEGRILLMPYSNPVGLCLNSRVVPLNQTMKIPIGEGLLGRVITPVGEALDDGCSLEKLSKSSCCTQPINPLHRTPIEDVLETGVRAIDGFCPLGRGQRIGIMAGSGVGKSTLLGMVARHTEADVIVIALIGERGREVGEFVRDILDKEGLARAVVVAASAEQPAVMRRQAAFSATAIAEWFRKQGKDVLLIMDSITRFAMAQREIGISTGEALGSRGYPASVFALLPPLVERAGTVKGEGSITAVYTVLVEGDDMNEPVTDHMRSLLDGHIVLTRELAARGHFPSIDVLQSVSRLSHKLYNDEQAAAVRQLRASLATYAASQDFIELGAYEPGKNQDLDQAIESKAGIDVFLKQELLEACSLKATHEQMKKLSGAQV